MGRCCAFLILLAAVIGAAGKSCSDFFTGSVQTHWADLPAKQRKALKTCGFDRNAWDGPSTCAMCWADMNKEQQEAAKLLGTDEGCNDKAMNAAGGKCKPKAQPGAGCVAASGFYADKIQMVSHSWDDLPPAVRKAARTCGSTKKTWDGPTDCRKCFNDLDKEKQRAAMTLVGDEACYEEYFKSTWGIDCGKLLKDNPQASDRLAEYEKLSQKFQMRKFGGISENAVPWQTLGAVSFCALTLSAVGLTVSHIAHRRQARSQPISEQSWDPEERTSLISVERDDCSVPLE